MRDDILEKLQNEIHNRCLAETNKFGIGCYCHIAAVVKNAALLAHKYGADVEVVMIAAWLHDIASGANVLTAFFEEIQSYQRFAGCHAAIFTPEN